MIFQRMVGFVDPSALPDNPGWPLRNLLAYLRALYPSSTSTVRVLCWRDNDAPAADKPWKSRFGIVETAGTVDGGATTRPSAVGWEKNVQGKLGPRLADLAPMMDPTKLVHVHFIFRSSEGMCICRLADQAVDLNLKLMRWRILPSLDLDKIAATKCLLLGAGTLGCYVARTLMVCIAVRQSASSISEHLFIRAGVCVPSHWSILRVCRSPIQFGNPFLNLKIVSMVVNPRRHVRRST